MTDERTRDQPGSADAAPTGPPPVPELVTGPDDITRGLRELRGWAGSPSFSAIVRAVSTARRHRGVPASEATPGRVTVYDCFRDGRRRLDPSLVVDVAAALGADRAQQIQWRQSVAAALSPSQGVGTAPITADPDAPAGFVGRRAELDLLVGGGSGPLRSALVEGMPGVGKSSLALQAAHGLLGAGRVGRILLVHLRGYVPGLPAVRPDSVVDAVLRLLLPRSAIPPDPTGRAEAWRDLLRAQALALVLDDAASAEQVLPLLPGPGSAATVILTSRTRLELGPDVERIALRELDAADAIRLLRPETRPEDAERPAGAEDALRSLCAATGHLPLALDLLARRMALLPGWTVQDHLAAYRRRLDLLELDEAVMAGIAVSVDALDPPDRGVLGALGLHPGQDVDLAALLALVGPEVGADEVAVALSRLEDRHLVRSATPGRWQMHDVVRTYAHRHAVLHRPPSRLDSARARLLDHYLELAVRAVGSVIPMAFGDWGWVDRDAVPVMERDEAVRVLTAERATLLLCAPWAARHGHHEHAHRLAAVLAHHLWQHGDTEGTIALHRVARAASVELGNTEGEALAERNLGSTFIRVGRYAQAGPRLERALDLYRRLDHRSGQIATLNAIGYLVSATGDHERAVEIFTELVERLEGPAESGERWAVAASNLAVAEIRAGAPDRGRERLEEVAGVAARSGWSEREQWARSNLAPMLVLCGRGAEALANAERAHALAVRADDRLGTGYALAGLAAAHQAVGQPSEADRAAADALEVADEVDAPDLRAQVLNVLGDLATGREDPATATTRYREALELAESIGEATEADRARAGLARRGS